MKFTFKTDKPTGKYKSFDRPIHNVKLEGIEVGRINPDAPFKIRLRVTKSNINEDGNPNCPWKWIQLKKESESLQEAKDFLNSHCDDILLKLKIDLS
jgi:hypothetical protein